MTNWSLSVKSSHELHSCTDNDLFDVYLPGPLIPTLTNIYHNWDLLPDYKYHYKQYLVELFIPNSLVRTYKTSHL